MLLQKVVDLLKCVDGQCRIGAGDAAASPSKKFFGKLIRFRQIWLHSSKIETKFGQKWFYLFI